MIRIIGIAIIFIITLVVSIIRRSDLREFDENTNINYSPSLSDDGFDKIIVTNMNEHYDYYVPPKPKMEPRKPEFDTFWNKVDAEISHKGIRKMKKSQIDSYRSPLISSEEGSKFIMPKPKVTKKTYRYEETDSDDSTQKFKPNTLVIEENESEFESPTSADSISINQLEFDEETGGVSKDVESQDALKSNEQPIDISEKKPTKVDQPADIEPSHQPDINKPSPSYKESEFESEDYNEEETAEKIRTEKKQKALQKSSTNSKALPLSEINLLKLIEDFTPMNIYIQYGFFDNQYDIPTEISSSLIASEEDIVAMIKKVKGYGLLVDKQEDGIFGYPFKKKLVLSTVGKEKISSIE